MAGEVGPSMWAEPAHRLWRMPVAAPPAISSDDGRIVLRLPVEADIPALAGHAPDAAAHGIWLPVGRLDLDPATWAAWFVRELRLGWSAFGGRYGGGLVADVDSVRTVAFVNFVPLEPSVVELAYGVAPEARGQGVASGCADVAARWALDVGFDRVELHIDVGHAESQRVAAKASFTFSHHAGQRAGSTPPEYSDAIYIRGRPAR